MKHAIYASLLFADLKKALMSNQRSASPKAHAGQAGQGLVEYALILVLVAVVVIVILSLLGPQVGAVFHEVTCAMQSGEFIGDPDPNGWIYCNLPDGTILDYNIETGATRTQLD